MGFVTLEVCTGAKPALVQLSDSRLTIKRLLAVVFISLRRTDAVDGHKVEYLDDEGDWVSVVSDGEVAELFRLARSLEPRRLQVRVVPLRSTGTSSVPPTSFEAASLHSIASVPMPSSFLPPSAPFAASTLRPELWDNTLNFFVNGSPISVTNPDPKMLLVDYLRDLLQLKGTKIGCGEGGCGACTVVLSWQNSGGQTQYESVNSCLRPLCSMDGFNVITAEGIGSKLKGYHPVQTALAKANGSQCGFCSVGWTMQAYKMLQDNPTPEAFQVDNGFDGNLCRCTGLFPILNAYKTFCPSSEGKDGSCCGTCEGCTSRTVATAKPSTAIVKKSGGGCCGGSGSGGKCGSSSTVALPPAMPLPEPLKRWVRVPKHFKTTVSPLLSAAPTTTSWYSPVTLTDLIALQAQFATAPAGTVKYVCGNTAYGVEKYFNTPSYPTGYTVFIDVTNVPDLNVTSAASSGLTVGAAVSLAQLIVLCNQQDPMSPLYTNDAKTEAVTTATSSFSALARHLLLVATRQVRSVGSWAGNLMLATHYHDFPSDVALVLMSLGVQVTIVQAGTTMTVPIEQVYASATLNTASTIIVSMTIPNLQGVTAAKPGPYVIDSFKAMLRHQNSHALVNAGFLLTLGAGNVVSAARIFYGGVSKQIFRATRTEAQIVGNALTQTVLTTALTALQQDIDNAGASTYYGTTDAYRRQVASSFLYKLFIRALPSSSISARNASAGERYVRPVSSESATYSSDPAEAPVSDPVMKLGALKQVAGEAIYTFDEKQERDGLYGALATTQVAAGTISAIDTTAAAAMPGVVRILTVSDIPAGGKNDIGPNPGQEKMFLAVGDVVGCIGQSVALIVADTFQHALEASRAVVITVSAPSVPPIFTIADAIAANSLYPNGTPGRMVPPQGIIKGDASGAMKTAATTVTGTVTVGGQKHMYMEVQNACAKLLEDDTLEVSVSTQSPGLCQYMACNITGMTSNQVNITTRRSGGGYGGKGTRMAPVVASASLAALVMGKQVHVQMERCQDMIMTGGREDLYAEYEVGVDAAGVIQAMIVTWYTNGGAFMDGGYGDLDMLMMWADTVYNFPNYNAQGYVCKTNLAAVTSTRAPGVPQSIFAMESIMDQLAVKLDMDPYALRQANFVAVGDTTPYGQEIQYCSLPTVWQQTMEQSNFDTVKASVDSFNEANRWRKRGVAVMPLKYGITWYGYNAEAIIRIYAADGTVEVSTSGCEIGQGLYTKVAQAVAFKLGIDLSLITVSSTRSDATPANSVTGGSGTSEVSVMAALNACDIINTRLAPVKTSNPTATWPELIGIASGNGIDLLAEGWFSPLQTVPTQVFQYYVFAAACTVVEIDVLTGELEILSTDLVYDCGESLNPLIDVGQVEGAYVMGLGLFLTENLAFDSTGQLLSVGTFEYKPMFPLDIPQQMTVTLIPDAPNPVGILSSKATGEPSLALGASAHFAIKYAVRAARADAGGAPADFELPAPATPCQIATACMTQTSMMVLN